MTDIALTSAKYLIIILFAYFTYISFRAQRDVPDERKKLSFLLQRITMLLIHAVAFFSIFIHVQQDSAIEMTMGQAIGIYAGQLLYLIVMSCLIPHFVPLSKGLNNVMCMFLAVGFIIQTRLDFDISLRQLLIVAVGSVVFLFCVFFCKRAKFMRNLTWIYAFVGLALLAVMLVLSRVVYGAKIAIELGFFSFQPAEFVKILFVLFVASAFYRANNLKTVLITAACAAIHVLILVLCHDLGSALILFAIYVFMLYAATKKLGYVIISLLGLAVASVAAYFLFSHVRVRVTAWLDPWSNIDTTGYQVAQALFAVGTGGWFGSGLFGGKPKSVPAVSNDMVFSAISEEMGGLFSLLLILLCLCFVLMIFRVALRVNNPFYKLLAFGLGSAYGFQVFLTIGGTIKFIPLTGVNLPFISNGGSSLLASLIMLGMVQALYVISEADVEREREMVAAGVPITAFEGYEPEETILAEKEERDFEERRHPDRRDEEREEDRRRAEKRAERREEERRGSDRREKHRGEEDPRKKRRNPERVDEYSEEEYERPERREEFFEEEYRNQGYKDEYAEEYRRPERKRRRRNPEPVASERMRNKDPDVPSQKDRIREIRSPEEADLEEEYFAEPFFADDGFGGDYVDNDIFEENLPVLRQKDRIMEVVPEEELEATRKVPNIRKRRHNGQSDS